MRPTLEPCLQGDRDARRTDEAFDQRTVQRTVGRTGRDDDVADNTQVGPRSEQVRYSGPGRSPLPIIAAVVIAIVVIAAIYFLIVQPR